MKILQLKTSSARGGAETLLLHLTRGLQARGHDLLTALAEPGWLEGRLQAEGLECRVLPLSGPRQFLGMLKLYAHIRGHRPDIVVSHGARVNLIGSTLASLVPIPSVSVEHGIDSWRVQSPHLSFLDQLSAMQNRGRIAVSRAVGDMLLSERLVNPRSLAMIPNSLPITSAANPAARSALLASLDWPTDSKVIVCVARLAPVKGHMHLLQAVGSLKDKHPALRLLLLGEGPSRGHLENAASRLMPRHMFSFMGAVDDVPAFLASSDLFVLPSLSEGLPMALIEAMGQGLPVVATEVGGVPELVEHGSCGLLVTPGDEKGLAQAIEKLILNPSLAAALATTGQHKARADYDFEKALSQYEEILKEWSQG